MITLLDILPKCSLRVFMVPRWNDRFLEAANRHMGSVVFPTGVTHLNNSNSNWGQMNNAYFFFFMGALLSGNEPLGRYFPSSQFSRQVKRKQMRERTGGVWMFRIQAFATRRVHVGTIKGECRDVVHLLTCIQYRNNRFLMSTAGAWPRPVNTSLKWLLSLEGGIASSY